METVIITVRVKDSYESCLYSRGSVIVDNAGQHALRLVVNADLFGLRTITLLDVVLVGPFERPLEPGSKNGSKKSTSCKFHGGKASAKFTWSTQSHSWGSGDQRISYNMECDKRPNVQKLLASLNEMRNTFYAERDASCRADIEELKTNIEAAKKTVRIYKSLRATDHPTLSGQIMALDANF